MADDKVEAAVDEMSPCVAVVLLAIWESVYDFADVSVEAAVLETRLCEAVVLLTI